MFRSQDIQFFVFLTIPYLPNLWRHDEYYYMRQGTKPLVEYIFWTTTHWVIKLGQLIDISKGNTFQESFEQFGGLGLGFRSFSIKQPAPIFHSRF